MAGDKQITIIGCGPAGPEYLIPLAAESIQGADVIAGTKKLLEVYAPKGKVTFNLTTDIPGFLYQLEQHLSHNLKVAVLVTGDPGIASLAKPVIEQFGIDRCRCIPGISSIQLACARLGIDWTDALLINAHRAIPQYSVHDLASKETIIILCGNPKSWGWVLDTANHLQYTHTGYMCSDLGQKYERVKLFNPDNGATVTDGGGNTLLVWRRKDNT